MRSHYHVIESTPGYLPDSDPATFTNKRTAIAHAYSLCRELREDGYRMSGSQGNYSGTTDAKMYDLGRVIETFECCEAES